MTSVTRDTRDALGATTPDSGTITDGGSPRPQAAAPGEVDGGKLTWEAYIGDLLNEIEAGLKEGGDHEAYVEADWFIQDALLKKNKEVRDALFLHAMRGNITAATYLYQNIDALADANEQDALAEEFGLGEGGYTFFSSACRIKGSTEILRDGEKMSKEIESFQNSEIKGAIDNPEMYAIGNHYSAIMESTYELLQKYPNKWSQLVTFLGGEGELRDTLIEAVRYFETHPELRAAILTQVSLETYREFFRTKIGLEPGQ